jgi:hypothetical protein
MKGRVCSLQLLLGLASVVFLGSESRVSSNHIFTVSNDSPNLEGQIPAFISPRNGVAQLYPQERGYELLSNKSSHL